VELRLPSWTRQPSAFWRVSSRIKAMMRSIPINPQPSVVIDLTINTTVGATRRGRGRDVAGSGRRATTTNTAPSICC